MTEGRNRFQECKAAGRPIAMLTCYDYPTAVLQDEAGLDIIFVGDSVGTNVLGYTNETEVTMDDMLHHLGAVRRGVKHAYLLVDMPFGSYATPEAALQNARRFLEAGADGVKLEGGREQVPVVRALTDQGIEVCGHIGFTPQTFGSKGKVQGRTYSKARELIESALLLEEAGVMLLVLELVTQEVAEIITQRLRVPTIGIGSGAACDGQVLVVTDLLGLSPFSRKIVRRYADLRDTELAAFTAYRQDVVGRQFPTEANAFATPPDEAERLRAEFLPTASARR